MNFEKAEQKINIWCEFENKNIEEEYFVWDIEKSIKNIKVLMILYSVLDFLFIIPDFLYMQNTPDFFNIFMGRFFFIVLFLFFYFYIGKAKSYNYFAYLITGLEVLFLLFFLFVLYKYNTSNFLIQTLAMVVILLGLFILPNKWIYNFFVSIFSIAAFLIYTYIFTKNLAFYEFMSGFIYLLIIVIFCSVFSFILNYYKRIHYATNKQLELLVILDHMTGIYNKRKFEEELTKNIYHSKRYGSSLSLAIFDFDNFKRINDIYGHVYGDSVIINAISLVNKMIRQTDVFSKWGGDEFTLLMPCTDLEDSVVLVERIRKAIENYSVGEIKISCSFGVTQLREDDDEITLFNRADRLLYTAKKEGKNNIKYEE